MKLAFVQALLLSQAVTAVVGQININDGFTLKKFVVHSYVHMRKATTYIRSYVENPTPSPRTFTYSAYLPPDAFVSNFTMSMDGYMSIAAVDGRKSAQLRYDQQRQMGNTAGLIKKASDGANAFLTEISISPGKIVLFELTYEERLIRKEGLYRHVINVIPHLDPQELEVKVMITERGLIDENKLRVPRFSAAHSGKTNIELLREPQEEGALMRKHITETFSEVEVYYEPSIQSMHEGGQMVVLFDVESCELQVIGDQLYFPCVLPDNAPKAPVGGTDDLFVIDMSYSMKRNWDSVKQAVDQLLTEKLQANRGGRFNIFLFNSQLQAWKLESQPVNDWTKRDAINYLNMIQPRGGTNIADAIMIPVQMMNAEARSGTTMEKRLFFCTDGHHTRGPRMTSQDILGNATRANFYRHKIHTLSFGRDAHYDLLYSLSQHNQGHAEKVATTDKVRTDYSYAVSPPPISTQFSDFYRQTAYPRLTNIQYKFFPSGADPTNPIYDFVSLDTSHNPTYYAGGELVVSGRLNIPPPSAPRLYADLGSIFQQYVPMDYINQFIDPIQSPINSYPMYQPSQYPTQTGSYPSYPTLDSIGYQVSGTNMYGREITYQGTGKVYDNVELDDVDFLRRLNAYMKVRQLLADSKGYPEGSYQRTQLEEQIVMECKQHNFVTELTSLILIPLVGAGSPGGVPISELTPPPTWSGWSHTTPPPTPWWQTTAPSTATPWWQTTAPSTATPWWQTTRVPTVVTLPTTLPPWVQTTTTTTPAPGTTKAPLATITTTTVAGTTTTEDWLCAITGDCGGSDPGNDVTWDPCAMYGCDDGGQPQYPTGGVDYTLPPDGGGDGSIDYSEYLGGAIDYGNYADLLGGGDDPLAGLGDIPMGMADIGCEAGTTACAGTDDPPTILHDTCPVPNSFSDKASLRGAAWAAVANRRKNCTLDINFAVDISEGFDEKKGAGMSFTGIYLLKRILQAFLLMKNKSQRIGLITYKNPLQAGIVSLNDKTPRLLLPKRSIGSMESMGYKINNLKCFDAKSEGSIFGLAFRSFALAPKRNAKRVLVLISGDKDYRALLRSRRQRALLQALRKQKVTIVVVSPHQTNAKSIRILRFIAGSKVVVTKPNEILLTKYLCS